MQAPLPTEIDAVTRLTVLFSLVLALSFVIERILELAKAAFDMYDSRNDLYKFWTKRARRLQQYIEGRLRVFQYVDESAAAGLLHRFDEVMLGARDGHRGAVPILSGDLVRAVSIRAVLKTTGCVLGIGLAFLFNVDLLAISRMTGAAATSGAVAEATVFGKILTGVVVGLGSGIVHKVITAIERRQKRASAEVANA